MNEYLMLGLVGAAALAVGFGVSWVGRAISGKKSTKTDKVG